GRIALATVGRKDALPRNAVKVATVGEAYEPIAVTPLLAGLVLGCVIDTRASPVLRAALLGRQQERLHLSDLSNVYLQAQTGTSA
ncbi:MAG: hypothetical protein KKI08_28180, partial [Armatimonadetes bacterium]|nr:hypothetical protein [Armatimonadota bacterium]